MFKSFRGVAPFRADRHLSDPNMQQTTTNKKEEEERKRKKREREREKKKKRVINILSLLLLKPPPHLVKRFLPHQKFHLLQHLAFAPKLHY